MIICMYLCPEVIFWLEAEDFHGRDVQVHQDVLERRTISWLGGPALLDQQLVPVGAGGGDWQLEGVAAHAPDDGRAVDILVWHLARQELPKKNPERPDVNLLVAGLVPDDLRCHPGNRSGEAHARRLLSAPRPARAEVADLDDLVAADQNTF